MIEIKGLSKSYGKKVALRDIDLRIEDGSVLGLVGINGAGKSTLLRLMSGVLIPDSGEILVDGEPLLSSEEKRRGIFFLPDDPYYETHATGETLAGLYALFYPFDRETFLRYAGIFQTETDKPLRNFSKGMRRRLFLCLAFACRPRVLYLDEAFDGLDPAARLECKRAIITLQENGGTAVIASHSLRELEDICDCFALLDGTRIRSRGRIGETLESFCRVQAVFRTDVQASDLPFECLSFERTGRVTHIVAAGDRESVLAALRALDPLVLEELPLDFEDYFLCETQSGGGQDR